MGDRWLREGRPQVGWLFDGNPSTPHRAAMLEDTGSQVVLTLPTQGLASDDPYSRWFADGIRFADDPDRVNFSYSPPRNILFLCGEGRAVLIGCRATGHRQTPEAGAGRIVANYAVLGGRSLRYDRVNSVRSELPVMPGWTGITSVKREPELDEHRRVQGLRIALDSPDEIRLDRRFNLSLRPAWRTSNPEVGAFASHDAVQLTTARQSAAPLEDHLQVHEAIRNLLVLSAWRSLGYSRVEVSRADDVAGRSPESMSPNWRELVTHRLDQHQPWEQTPRFLFDFKHIGRRGIGRWLTVRSRYERALQPLIAVAHVEGHLLETRMMLVSIAIEALGYQLAVDAGGEALDRFGGVKFPAALDLVLADTPWIPFDDVEGWKKRANAGYKGIKHADNPPQDSLEVLNTVRESLLLLRCWLACRLGCDPRVLQKRLPGDPLSSEYIAFD